MIRLELPLPPSKNRLHVAATRATKRSSGECHTYQGQRNSDEYVAYRAEVWALVMQQTTPDERELLAGRKLAVHAMIRFPVGDRRAARGDAANIVDALLDSLAPALGVDDSAFWSGQWTRHEHASVPECLVTVWILPEEG